jgi:hypothetical protein
MFPRLDPQGLSDIVDDQKMVVYDLLMQREALAGAGHGLQLAAS